MHSFKECWTINSRAHFVHFPLAVFPALTVCFQAWTHQPLGHLPPPLLPACCAEPRLLTALACLALKTVAATEHAGMPRIRKTAIPASLTEASAVVMRSSDFFICDFHSSTALSPRLQLRYFGDARLALSCNCSSSEGSFLNSLMSHPLRITTQVHARTMKAAGCQMRTVIRLVSTGLWLQVQVCLRGGTKLSIEKIIHAETTERRV